MRTRLPLRATLKATAVAALAAAASLAAAACGRIEGATRWQEVAHERPEAPTRTAETQIFPVPKPPFTEGIFPCSRCHDGGEPVKDVLPAIPHAPHLAKGLECSDCHSPDDPEAAPKIPDREVCNQCHADAAKLTPRAKAYFDAVTRPDGTTAFPHRWKTRDVRPEHERHTKAGIACANCHGEPSDEPFEKPRPVTLMDRCIACHAEKGKPVKCETCHTDTTKKQHANIVLHHAEQQRGCLDCHDAADRDHLRLANGTKVSFAESYKLCGQCHGTQYRDWKIGLHGKRTGSWDGRREYRLCVHCHYPHDPKFPPMTPVSEPLPPKEVR